MAKKHAYLAVSTVLSLILSATFVPAVSADIYKYVDSEGIVHFSNEPVPKVSQQVVKESSAARAAKGGPVLTPTTKLASYGKNDNAKAAPAVYKAPEDNFGEEVPYADIIYAKCDKYGVEPGLVKSIIKAESAFHADAVSPKGAKGLMQLMPATASDMGVYDIFSPEQNIDGGVKYLKYLLDTFGGDVELSVAAYNCGQGKVIRNGMCVPEIPETKNYVKKVLRLSQNPVTGKTFSRTLYKIELKDGSILFTDSPVGSGGKLAIVQ